MSDSLIEEITHDLRPVKPLSFAVLATVMGLAYICAIIFIYAILGFRSEISDLLAGVWPDNMMALAKPLVFFITSVCALWSIKSLYRPEGRLKANTLLPIMIMICVLVYVFISDLTTQGLDVIMANLNGGADICFNTILVGGIVVFSLVWILWLRRTASSYPRLLGMLGGLMCASLMASAYALHCSMDASAYLLIIYGGSIVVFSLATMLMGRLLFRW